MKGKIVLVKGDITKMEVDAIVNAANKKLMGGGGVDGAIHAAGGPEILRACKRYIDENGECPTGHSVITTAGKLPAKYVIHTVGPVWQGGHLGEDKALYECYEKSLDLAHQYGLQTIAFPNISTGVYGYPKKEAAEIAVNAVRDYMEVHNAPIQITFVC